MITCWLNRTILSSHIDGNTALPEWVNDHVRGCGKCRGFYESAMLLAQRLSSDVNTGREPAPPFLHAKIISTLRVTERREVQPGRGRLAWATALGLACLFAAGMLWLSQPRVPARIARSPVTSPTELALKVNLPSAAQLEGWTTSLDAPLEQETQLVLLDARTAIDTLARSFVPEDFLAASGKTERH
jgi:hypothetical protein